MTAQNLGDLHGKAADTTRATVDENLVAFFDIGLDCLYKIVVSEMGDIKWKKRDIR